MHETSERLLLRSDDAERWKDITKDMMLIPNKGFKLYIRKSDSTFFFIDF